MAIVVIFLRAVPALAEDFCAQHYRDVEIEKIEASASFWSNLRGSDGSIRIESNKIFHKALDSFSSLEAPRDLCPSGCVVNTTPIIYFSSAPQKLLVEYDDAEHCRLLFKATSKKPYQYQNSKIEELDDLNEWIGDLSRGDGTAGENLYERCDGSCSPRYEYFISKNTESSGFSVRASIVCGEARDKDHAMYDLNSFFRWTCKRT